MEVTSKKAQIIMKKIRDTREGKREEKTKCLGGEVRWERQ